MKIICLDAGHGYNTAGKRTPKFSDGTSIREAEQNYPIMEQLGECLEYNGFKVIYTNKNMQYDMPLSERTNYANNQKADIFISIHKNAFTGKWQTSAKGIETYHYTGSSKGQKIAECVQESLIQETKMQDRKVKTNNSWAVLKNTNMPAILVELGFMDYQPEALQMKDEEWHNKYAKAIVEGVCQYYGISPKFSEDTKKEEKVYYRAMAGSFTTKENAQKQVNALKKAGFDACIMLSE